jgi:hypothetical protein
MLICAIDSPEKTPPGHAVGSGTQATANRKF